MAVNEMEAPELPSGEIAVEKPPSQVEAGGMGSILATAIPMMGSMGVMVIMALTQGQNTRMLLMAGGMVFMMLSMVGFNIYRLVSQYHNNVNSQRREYLSYLSETRTSVRNIAAKQRIFMQWYLPEPDSLVLLAEEGSRLWEREVGDDTSVSTRIGTSDQELAMRLVEPDIPQMANPDVVCHSAMRRFLDVHKTVEDLPFSLDLGQFSHVEVAGDGERARGEVRSMICHLAVMTPDSALKIAVLTTPENLPNWEWMKWLPHIRSAEVTDALGGARMVCTSYAELEDLLGEEMTTRGHFQPRNDASPWPHLIVITDGAELPPDSHLGSIEGCAGVTIMKVLTSWGMFMNPTGVRLLLHPANDEHTPMEVLLLEAKPVLANADYMGIPQAEAVARRLTRFLTAGGRDAATPVGKPDPKRSQDLMELLNIGDIRDFDAERQWKRRNGRDRLRVPFAVTPEGIPVVLDIKEAAQQGMGPHGLLIGATGSGKSEVLRTLVLALALTHSPEQLNFVLVDFKGGATFAGMSDLPHVSAMISNLESELSLVDRMEDALHGEMVRRQEILRDAGNYANVTDYEADRLAGKHDFPVLPALFIILDEFSELLTAKPDFGELFVAIGRLGRSLSIHILLSSQRLESGKLKGLDSHLSYRIGLKTFSASESREVLGVNDAYDLPPYPGSGFLQPGTDQLIRFRASYVAAPPPPRSVLPSSGSEASQIRLLPFSLGEVLDSTPEEEAIPEGGLVAPGDERWEGMTEIDIAVARMKGKGMPAHQVWLPPLDVPDTMDSLMPDLAVDPELGLISHEWRAKGPLHIPMGIVDLPHEQRREVLEYDFAGAGGHMSILGGPLSGKSTALRSIVMALSLTHTPKEVQFFVIDFSGTFAAFEGAAHVAGVASREDEDILNRMVSEIEGIIEDRAAYFRANRIDSMATYRRGRAQGRFDDGYGDIFLVVDGWGTLRSDFSDAEDRIRLMAERALSFGVHFIATALRKMDFRIQMQDIFGSRMELRMGDPSDSEFRREIGSKVPEGRPGRGLSMTGHHMLVALPRADGDHDPATIGEGVEKTLLRIASATEPGPRLRLLPEKITVSQIEATHGKQQKIVLGLEERRLSPWTFDPENESHMYVYGDAKCGKTAFLRNLGNQVLAKPGSRRAMLVVVDVRRSLLGEWDESDMPMYITNRDEIQGSMEAVAEQLRMRLPGPDVTPEQLRKRNWWKGAEAWVLVDDYDLISTGGLSGSPLAPLQPLLSQAQDIGFHLVITRRMGGASRASYEQILQSLSELSATGIMMSGNPSEGMVIGRERPRILPKGRGLVVSRDQGTFLAQMAWSESRVK